MTNKVYKFNLSQPAIFYKAGQYLADTGWQHKDIINHGDYELFVVLKGAAYIQIGADKFVVGPHECLLIPPAVRHVGYQGSPAGTDYYWMHFYSQANVPLDNFPVPDMHEPVAYLPQIFKLENFERFALLMRQLLDSANRSATLEITSNYLISAILIELANQYLSLSQKQQSTVPSTRFELIKNWIRIHSHEPLTVQRVSENFHITPTYLAQIFRERHQVTPVQFINRVKIAQAQELLLTTDATIKQIALELSFRDEKYFLRVFKQQTGITPSKFRNSYDKTYLNNPQVDPTIPKPASLNR
ncbi:helix-turn-helix domain-containing protein [Levilactobacillus cerevisiae]